MGSFTSEKLGLVTSISEVVGYKSGLALNIEEFRDLLRDEPYYLDYFVEPLDQIVRIRSEDFEQLFTVILYRLGAIESPVHSYLITRPYDENYQVKEIDLEIGKLFTKHLNEEVMNADSGSTIELDGFRSEVIKKYGTEGLNIARGMVLRFFANAERSPYSVDRYIDWKDTKQLDQLFKSENLETFHGNYFDQRFINFLERNFKEIDNINWRQFEALTAEYLIKAGFQVDIGPGRNDGGIDIRAWAQSDTKLPPTILVQCKRQKNKVEKVVVKALWADMQDEGVESGLIVTSSAVSPGALQVSQARNYNIEEANRKTLKEWLKAMRTPGKGIFLGK